MSLYPALQLADRDEDELAGQHNLQLGLHAPLEVVEADPERRSRLAARERVAGNGLNGSLRRLRHGHSELPTDAMLAAKNPLRRVFRTTPERQVPACLQLALRDESPHTMLQLSLRASRLNEPRAGRAFAPARFLEFFAAPGNH